MAASQTNIGVNARGNLRADQISVVQNIVTPADPPPKNVRFKVQKPIQTFTGRETFLEVLHKRVKEGQDGGVGGVTVLTQQPLSVVAATGGIGKTETVRMYIKLHEHEYDHIIWIDAEKASIAKSQFTQLAMKLKIPADFEGKPKEFELLLSEIFEKLLFSAHVVLLVFDNAETLEDDEELNLSGIRSLCPTSLSPFFVEPIIIVTSRNQSWGMNNVISLGLWTEEEVLLFVTQRLRLERNPKNETLALQLGTLFGRLPIALQAAVAVIFQQTRRNKKYGIQSLIDEYESGSERRKEVLAQKPLDANMRPTQTSIPMLVLWNISLEKIVKFENGALAIKILCFMAYMSPTRIPHDFLYALFKNDCTEDSFENASEILEDYSLIASSSSDDSDCRSFSIHRMIQDSTIENLRTRTTHEGQKPHVIFNGNTFSNETEVLRKLSFESVHYMCSLLRENTSQRFREFVEILVEITNHMSGKLDVAQFRDLTEYTADVLRFAHNFPKSIELFERALKASPSGNEIEIEKKTSLKGELAVAYCESGQLQKALDLFFEVLEVQIRIYGPHHKKTLQTKSTVAGALRKVGRKDEATEMFREVLQGYKNNGDTQSDDYLEAKFNYAALLCDKGESKVASELLTQVLKEQEKEPESNSTRILNTKLKIAANQKHEGHLEEALKIWLQKIEDATKRLGPFHLITLECRKMYASELHEQGKNDLAASLLVELLETLETQLIRSDHFITLQTKFLLALVYLETEELDKAEALLDVEVMERMYGPEHAETMNATTALSYVKEEQGKFDEAIALQQKVLEVRKNGFGPNDEKTMVYMMRIAFLYVKIESNEKAAEMTQEVLKRQEKALGKNHPHTIKTLELLTWIRSQEASKWDLEVPIPRHAAPNTYRYISPNDYTRDLNWGQGHALISSGTTTAAENENVDTAPHNETVVNSIQDLGVQVKSFSKYNEPTTSISFRLPGGTRLRGEFGVSCTVKHLYEFVNGTRPDLADSNYVLTLYPNIELTKMGETLEESNLLNNVALTLKMLKK